MNSEERDIKLIQKIILYCRRVQEVRNRFGDSLEDFSEDYAYRDLCGMYILQIGELAGKLSDATQRGIPEIPWRLIRAMRNVLAHDYDAVDVDALWATVSEDLPTLRVSCEKYLKEK